MNKIIEYQQTKTSNKKRNNSLLFIGTSKKGVEEILKEGLKISKGWFIKAFYMTNNDANKPKLFSAF